MLPSIRTGRLECLLELYSWIFRGCSFCSCNFDVLSNGRGSHRRNLERKKKMKRIIILIMTSFIITISYAAPPRGGRAGHHSPPPRNHCSPPRGGHRHSHPSSIPRRPPPPPVRHHSRGIHFSSGSGFSRSWSWSSSGSSYYSVGRIISQPAVETTTVIIPNQTSTNQAIIINQPAQQSNGIGINIFGLRIGIGF